MNDITSLVNWRNITWSFAMTDLSTARSEASTAMALTFLHILAWNFRVSGIASLTNLNFVHFIEEPRYADN